MTEISEILSMVESKMNLASEDAKADIEDFRPPPDITDLATVLNTEDDSKGKDFIFRKGTTSDVFKTSEDIGRVEGLCSFLILELIFDRFNKIYFRI